jgi:PAS domain S-box-containing protein
LKQKKNNNLVNRKNKKSLMRSPANKPLSREQARKRSEEEIRTLKKQIEFILGVTKTGLDIIDSEFNIQYIDPEWAKVYGAPTGKKCYEYFMGRNEICPTCGIPKALKTKTNTVTEEILVKEANRPIQVTTIPYQNSEGEWLVAKVNVDITERKRAEETLRKAYEELGIRFQERTAELAKANEALQADITERKRTEEALRRNEEESKRLAQENTIMAEIGRIISSTLNIQEVYERFAEEVHKLIPFDRIAINSINPEEQTFTVSYVTGLEIADRHQGDVVPMAGTSTEEAVRARSGLIIQTEDENEIATRFPGLLPSFWAGLRSMMMVPLISKDRVIGVLHFRSTRPNAYSERNLRLAERVGAQIAGAIANAQLFMERKQMEEKYRTIVRTTMDGFWIVDMQGRFLDVNDTYGRAIGYSRDELLTMSISDVEAEERPEETARRIQKIMEVGGDRFETRHKCKDGRIIDVEVSANYMEIGGGRMFVFLRDITERKKAEEALRTERDKFRGMLSAINDGVDIVNKDYIIEFQNEVLRERFGDRLGEKCYAAYMGLEEPCHFCSIQNAIKTGRATKLELIGKDGRNYELNSSPFTDVDGNVKVIELVRDITEHKRAEEALRESEERYRTILEDIEDGYYEVDLPGNLTFFNDSLCRMLGYSKDEMIGMSNKQYTDEENRNKLFQAFNKVYRTGEPTKGFDWEVIAKDGTKLFGEVSVSLIKDSEGRPCGFRGIARDVTERKQAEAALHTEKQRFQTLLENAPFGMIMIDKEGSFKYINAKFKELFGYDFNDVPNGREWFRKAYPDPAYRHQVISTWMNDLGIFQPGEKRSRTFTVTCKDGTEKMINFIPVQLETGENLMACEDTTERKRAEEEKAALEEQLRQSQRMEAIGRLAGGIAHDFNNLLTVIRGYSQLSLLEIKEGDKLRGNIEEIQKATQRATDLTRQLLAFGRRQIMNMKVIDLNLLIRELDKMLRRVIGEDIELVTILAEDLGRIKADPGQIEQVIINLAVNARDAMSEGGKLTIKTQNVEIDEDYVWAHVGVTSGSYAMLSITDTGCGMTPEVKDHLFEPFFTTKEVGKGTGLGLSTVYGIVKQSRGNIWAYSEPGRGTTFKIYLPWVDEPLKERSTRVLGEESPRGHETVLTVEDEEEVRKLAVQMLKRQGYAVFEASHGEEAMRVARDHAQEGIDLLLTDVVMPGMSGRELAEKLGSLLPKMKVLYMSGYTDDAIVHHGVLEDGVNYLQKPFTLDSLARKVREVLDQ